MLNANNCFDGSRIINIRDRDRAVIGKWYISDVRYESDFLRNLSSILVEIKEDKFVLKNPYTNHSVESTSIYEYEYDENQVIEYDEKNIISFKEQSGCDAVSVGDLYYFINRKGVMIGVYPLTNVKNNMFSTLDEVGAEKICPFFDYEKKRFDIAKQKVSSIMSKLNKKEKLELIKFIRSIAFQQGE